MPSDRDMDAETGERGERLRSWKQIARFLDRDIRTAMRWERDAGMPVHRIPGSTKGRSVFAFKGELEVWLAGDEVRRGASASRSRKGVAAWGALSLTFFVGVLALWAWKSHRSEEPTTRLPESYRIDASGKQLLARDSREEVIWALAHPEGREFFPYNMASAMVAERGERSLMVAVNSGRPQVDDLAIGELYSLTEAGALNWRLIPDRIHRFGNRDFGPPWVSRSLTVYELHGEPRTAWTVQHHTWWPSMLLITTPAGRVESRFVNAGWITLVRSVPSPDGVLLLAGGISNSHRAAMLAVLDANAPGGSSPEDPKSEFACDNCPPGSPLRYIVFPPTPANKASGLPYNRTIDIQLIPEGIKVSTLEASPPPWIHWVYLFSNDFEFLRSEPEDAYCSRLATLLSERNGQLTDPCPGQAGQTIRTWTPDAGWRTERPTFRRQ